MIDVDRFAKMLSGADLDGVILNLQSVQDQMRALSGKGRKAEREAAKERVYMTAVLVGALIYELAKASGEDESHARVLACCRLDSWAPELSRGLLFVHPGREESA